MLLAPSNHMLLHVSPFPSQPAPHAATIMISDEALTHGVLTLTLHDALPILWMCVQEFHALALCSPQNNRSRGRCRLPERRGRSPKAERALDSPSPCPLLGNHSLDMQGCSWPPQTTCSSMSAPSPRNPPRTRLRL